jgi:prepilin-type N-terminal cleavage/methylation domain-containing protein
MQTTRHNSGLTLVEILVVVSIIVILAAIVWKSNPALDEQAKVRKQQQAFLILDEALQEYFDSEGTFPDVNNIHFLDDTVNLYESLVSVAPGRRLVNTLPRDMVGPPRDAQGPLLSDQMILYDAWGSVLDYRWRAGAMSFPILESNGPNKQPELDRDTESDDIRNR